MVHPPVTVAPDFIDYPYFADLGAVQLAAVLEARQRVRLVDAYALPTSGLSWRSDGRAHLGASVDDVLAAVDAAGPRSAVDAVVVAYTPFHRPPQRDDVLGDLLAALAERFANAPRLLVDAYQSGQHYVEAPGPAVLAAYPEVDAWVKYEAEATVPALLDAWRDGGERPRGVHHGARPELDGLPWPAWHLVDRAAYATFHRRVVQDLGRRGFAFPIEGGALPMVTTRGCPFSCTHCSSNPDRRPGEPKTQRRYAPSRLRAYVEYLARTLGVRRLFVLDELINVSRTHFEHFLDAVQAEDLSFEIPNGMRADYLHPEHLARMKGRVTTVSVSAESGNPRVLAEVVDKQLDLAHIRRVAAEADTAGVPLMVHWMIGLPGESAAEINETLALALALYDEHGAWPAVQYATPLPGTALARGRTLPVVDDWGPRFQARPSEGATTVPAAELEQFMQTFQARLDASSGPQKLVMNVTYACNNHCTFCAVGTRTQLDGFAPRQREHLEHWRAQGVDMVDFDGGEPTLYPKLVPLIRHARAIGYRRINVTTNGRLCTYERYASDLVRSGLTTLLFSVHGPDARTHAQQVGVAEAFEQTVAGIENCVRLRPRSVELGMNVTITKGNHDKLHALTELAWSLGLRWVNLQFLTPFGRATQHVAPDTQAAADVAREVIDAYGARMKIQIINLPYCYMPGYEQHLEGDRLKLARHMVFVNNETVNLSGYLAERRVKKTVCETCPHACFCGGFYELDDVPEPPWIIAVEDVVAPRDGAGRRQ